MHYEALSKFQTSNLKNPPMKRSWEWKAHSKTQSLASFQIGLRMKWKSSSYNISSWCYQNCTVYYRFRYQEKEDLADLWTQSTSTEGPFKQCSGIIANFVGHLGYRKINGSLYFLLQSPWRVALCFHQVNEANEVWTPEIYPCYLISRTHKISFIQDLILDWERKLWTHHRQMTF